MKRLGFFLILLILILLGSYVWLNAQGGPDGADSTPVTIDLPLKSQ